MGKFVKKAGKAVVGGVKGWVTSGGNPLGAAAGALGGLLGDSQGDVAGRLSTDTQQTATMDPMVQAQLGRAYDAVNARAGEAYTPFSGQRVAGLNSDELAAADAVRGLQGSADRDYAGATGTATELARTGGVTAADVQEFYNPYEAGAVRAAQDDIAYQEALAQRGVAGRAEGAKAYGGSREAVARALTSGEYARTAASTAAQMRSQGYQQAAQLASQRAGLRLSGNGQLANLLDSRRAARESEINALDTVGAKARGVEQARNEAAYDGYLDERGYKDSRVQMLLDSVRAAPSGIGTTTTSETQTARGPSTDGAVDAALGADAVLDVWDQLKKRRQGTPQQTPVEQAPSWKGAIFGRIPRSSSG